MQGQDLTINHLIVLNDFEVISTRTCNFLIHRIGELGFEQSKAFDPAT